MQNGTRRCRFAEGFKPDQALAHALLAGAAMQSGALALRQTLTVWPDPYLPGFAPQL